MTRVVTVCLAGLALLVAGCGGDEVSKAEYEDQVSKAGQTLERTFGDLGEGLTGRSSPDEAGERLAQGADALDRAADQLGDIDAPSEIDDAHENVVEGLQQLAGDFREGAEAAEEGDRSALLRFATRLQRSEAVKKISEAGEKIEKEGFEFQAAGGNR